VKWSSSPGMPLISADRPSLLQVFINLVTNSIRALFNKDRRLLAVTATCEHNRVHDALKMQA